MLEPRKEPVTIKLEIDSDTKGMFHLGVIIGALMQHRTQINRVEVNDQNLTHMLFGERPPGGRQGRPPALPPSGDGR